MTQAFLLGTAFIWLTFSGPKQSVDQDKNLGRLHANMNIMGMTALPALNQSREMWDRLQPMEGYWEGTGWMEGGIGPRSEFIQQETVRLGYQQTLLNTDGFRRTSGFISNVGHDFRRVVVSYNDRKKLYTFHAHMENGLALQADAPFSNSSIEWVILCDTRDMDAYSQLGVKTLPQIRFTVRWSPKAREWYESGERLNDDKSWTKFFE